MSFKYENNNGSDGLGWFFVGGPSEPWRYVSSRNPPDCIILENWNFENFTLADEPFTKVLLICEACVLVNPNLGGAGGAEVILPPPPLVFP